MAIDLLCGQCQGHLLAEAPGSVVACPHCGAHLQVPGELEGELPSEAAQASEPRPQESLSMDAADTTSETAVPPEPVAILNGAPWTEESISAGGSTAMPLSELPSHSSLRMVSDVVPTPRETAPAAAHPPTQPAQAPEIVDTGRTAPATVPRFWFLFLLSYASAVTLAFLFLLLTLGRMKTHPLENLPDVVPKIQNGEVGLEVAPPDADVARGHVLALGETRRYGSLQVSPLRVTQAALKFEHVLGDPTAVRPPSEPVLKLWLKFENVSRNQTFSPLDSLLLFKRHYQDFSQAALTNQFLCRKEERTNRGNLHYLFEISTHSEFRIAGQNLSTVLAPGASVEMFIPSEERIEQLTGDLVWRVQFRKGYHPRTRHGVTTLIDVPFHRRDVKTEM